MYDTYKISLKEEVLTHYGYYIINRRYYIHVLDVNITYISEHVLKYENYYIYAVLLIFQH